MNTITDAKRVKKLVEPLIKSTFSRRSDRVVILPLVDSLKKEVDKQDLPEEYKRSIIFSFRDEGFLDFKETQDLWVDLADYWGISKYLPHLVNKTKL